MSGLIISVASLFDIGFNYIYGDIAEKNRIWQELSDHAGSNDTLYSVVCAGVP